MEFTQQSKLQKIERLIDSGINYYEKKIRKANTN